MDPDPTPEPTELWLPPRRRMSSPDPNRSGTPRPVRFRRSLARGVVVGPVVVIVALWWLVSLDGPAERAEATLWCGSALAVVLTLVIATHWPAVEATESHLSWMALPRPGAVPWANIRSIQLLGQSVTTGSSRVPTQWMTFVIDDPTRRREVKRHLAMLGLPRRELLIQCADNATASNPALAASLRQMAEHFTPTSRIHSIGSSPGAFVCAVVIAMGSAVAVIVSATG